MPRRRLRFWLLLAPLLTAAVLTAAAVLLSWRRPVLGPVAGRLRACPDRPNCVCSQEVDGPHSIEPLRFHGPADTAWRRLEAIVREDPRATIVALSGNYLHAEFTTPWLKFVDDVEFLLDEQAGVIHVRSASRVGRSDLGVNRRRVEQLRSAFRAAGLMRG